MGIEISPEDLEKLSNLEPHQVPKNLHPAIRKKVLDRMIEKRQGLPKKPKQKIAAPPKKKRRGRKPPTVKRGEGGKIESVRTPIVPYSEEDVKTIVNKKTVAAPTKKRRKTKTGKKLDKTTGKILRPSVKRGASGKIEALTEEEKTAQIKTDLPTANREVMDPKPAAQPVHPVGLLRMGGARKLGKGGSVSYPVISKKVGEALAHLKSAHFAIESGLNHEKHLEAFDTVHNEIQPMNKDLHTSLKVAKHLVQVSGGKMTPLLRQTYGTINTRLNNLREIHESNVRRAMEGRERKQGQ